ncbi:unnamed protein product, partial [Ectocarpus sp. 8 AP-2014]
RSTSRYDPCHEHPPTAISASTCSMSTHTHMNFCTSTPLCRVRLKLSISGTNRRVFHALLRVHNRNKIPSAASDRKHTNPRAHVTIDRVRRFWVVSLPAPMRQVRHALPTWTNAFDTLGRLESLSLV